MKRLYRSNSDKMIAGICGGIGEYFNIDPTIVRLVAVVLALLAWLVPAVVAYVIGWLIIPPAENVPAERNQS